jgi:hypothetical protein
MVEQIMQHYNQRIIFIIFLIITITFGLWAAYNVPLGPDEGTHATLALFYRDLLSAAPTLNWDPQTINEFGINYLIHYPKLTITYLPLYHLTLAPLLAISASIMTGRLLSLAYFALTMLLPYWIGNRYFGGPRSGLLAAVLFASLPAAWWGTYRVSIDWAAYLMCFASIGAYITALNRRDLRWYAAASVLAYFALLSRIFAVFPIVSMLLHAVIWGPRPRAPRLLALAIPFAILAVPTFLAFNYFGGLEASKFVAAEAAEAPWSIGGPLAPFYYIWIYPLETFGLGLLVIAAAALSLRGRIEQIDLFLLIWLAISYVALTPFQNPRYVVFILMPVILLAARWFATLPKARWPLVSLLVIALLLIPVWNTYTEVTSGSSQLAAERQLATFINENPGNIGILSEEPIFSSVYIWYASASDPEKLHSVYRPCFFSTFQGVNMTNETAANGLSTLVATRGGTNYQVLGQLVSGPPALSIEVGNETIEVYKIEVTKPAQICNMICLTNQYLCTNLSSPYELSRASGTATQGLP